MRMEDKPIICRYVVRKRNGFYAFLFPDAPYWFVVDNAMSYNLNIKILDMCNGHNSVNDIINELAKKVPTSVDELSLYVKTFLNTLEKANAIRLSTDLKIEPVIETKELPHLGDVSIGVTSRCNLTCKHCYIGEREQMSDELKTREIKKFLKDVVALMGVKKELTLTGGEPFLREDIIEILDHAVSLGFQKIFVITNGTLLSRETVLKLSEFNEKFKRSDEEGNKEFAIQVSIDGFKDTHEWVRGKGTWEKAVEAVKLLKENKITTIMTMIVHDRNFRDIPKIIQLAKRLKVPVNIESIIPIGKAKEHGLKVIPANKFIKYFYSNIGDDPELANILIGNPFSTCIVVLRNLVKLRSCGAGSSTVYLHSNGDVYPCPLFQGLPEFMAGNIREKPFLEIWKNAPILKELRSLHVDTMNEKCSKCDVRYFCGGGCRADAYVNSGNIKGVPSKCSSGEYIELVWESIWLLTRYPHLHAGVTPSKL